MLQLSFEILNSPFDGRCHHNELANSGDTGSVSGSSGHDLSENQKNDIKKIVEAGVKNAMYFV